MIIPKRASEMNFLNPTRLMVVEVYETSYGFYLGKQRSYVYVQYIQSPKINSKHPFIKLEKGDYKILGTFTNNLDADFNIEKYLDKNNEHHKDYTNNTYTLTSPNDSFMSLLMSHKVKITPHHKLLVIQRL